MAQPGELLRGKRNLLRDVSGQLVALVNRLEGKQDIIKGSTLHPQKSVHVTVNLNKLLSFLQSIPKFPQTHMLTYLGLAKSSTSASVARQNTLFWRLL